VTRIRGQNPRIASKVESILRSGNESACSAFFSLFIPSLTSTRHLSVLSCPWRWPGVFLNTACNTECWSFIWYFTSHVAGSRTAKCTSKSITRYCVYSRCLKWSETAAGHPCFIPRSRIIMQDLQSSFTQRYTSWGMDIRDMAMCAILQNARTAL
jgi:hypothetical protein